MGTRVAEVMTLRQFDDEGPRADGPPVVWAGPETGPALVVLDPAGAAKHADLPATWHRLAGSHQIAWCRLPASRRSLEDVEDVLETLADRQAPRVGLVATGEACADAVAVADRFPDLVDLVLLVDPDGDPAGDGRSPDRVRVVARSSDSDRDRIPAPLPLGHPDVVTGLTDALAGAAPTTTDGG